VDEPGYVCAVTQVQVVERFVVPLLTPDDEVIL
jgi:hypothetical protein